MDLLEDCDGLRDTINILLAVTADLRYELPLLYKRTRKASTGWPGRLGRRDFWLWTVDLCSKPRRGVYLSII